MPLKGFGMEDILLKGLLTVLLGLIAYIWRSHDRLHERLTEQIEQMEERHQSQTKECTSSFASKDSVARLWDSYTKQNDTLQQLDKRVGTLEKHL